MIIHEIAACNPLWKMWVALKRAGVNKRAICLVLLGLLWQKNGLDVGENTTLGNGDAGEKFVQFLVVTDGQLQMTGDDSCLLVVTGSVSCQFQNFSGQVFHDGSQVDWGTGTDSLGIVSFAEMSVDSSHGELKPGPG